MPQIITEPHWPDLEEWLCDDIRARLELPDDETAWVGSREPGPEVTDLWVIIVRLDYTDRLDVVTDQARIAVTVRGRVRDVTWKRTSDLARTVKWLIATSPQPGPDCPVAAVTAQNGPYRTSGRDVERPEYYQTAELTVVGS